MQIPGFLIIKMCCYRCMLCKQALVSCIIWLPWALPSNEHNGLIYRNSRYDISVFTSSQGSRWLCCRRISWFFFCNCILVCSDGRPVHACSLYLCRDKQCKARPGAVCRINPCGGCNAEFYDSSNTIVLCNEGRICSEVILLSFHLEAVICFLRMYQWLVPKKITIWKC